MRAGIIAVMLTVAVASSLPANIILVDWAGGGDFTTIQAGISASVSGDTVLVTPGTYSGPGNYDLNFVGRNIVVRCSGVPGSAIVDGGGGHSGVRFECSEDTTAVLDGLTITNATVGVKCYYYSRPTIKNVVISDCKYSGISCTVGSDPIISDSLITGDCYQPSGSGLEISFSSPVVRNVEFSGNTNLYGGAGLDCTGVASSPRFINCRFLGNRTDAGVGAGAHASSGLLTFEDCLFADNYAGTAGGGMHVEQDAHVVMLNCSFSDNESEDGGGLFLWNDATAELTDCKFSGNVAEVGGGIGAVNGSATLTGCSFTTNSANLGGAVHFQNSSLTAAHCSVSNNSAVALGGGVMSAGGCATELTMCTFDGNSATYQGAALHVGSGASLAASGCTFFGNASLTGTGLAVDDAAPMTVENCVIAFGSDGDAVSCNGAVAPSLACCDIFGNAGGDWEGCIAALLGTDGNICEDPLFCGDANPEEPYTLHENSPCAQENNPACGLIGAWGVACGVTAVEEMSWGSLKAMFR